MRSFVLRFTVMFAAVALGSLSAYGEFLTADVAVSSPGGQYTLLVADELVSTNWDRYYWYEMPTFAVQQDMLFWQYEHTGFPSVADGVITFEVLDDGPVLMACTTRWGGGGDSSGDWEDDVTVRAELEQQGWVEYATGLKDAERGGPVPCIEYVVFRRDCLAGEVFTYRTEKYRPPTIIRSITTVPEPSTFIMMFVGAVAGSLLFSRRR